MTRHQNTTDCPRCGQGNVINGREYAQDDHWARAYPRGPHTTAKCDAALARRQSTMDALTDRAYEADLYNAGANVHQHHVFTVGAETIRAIMVRRYTA